MFEFLNSATFFFLGAAFVVVFFFGVHIGASEQKRLATFALDEIILRLNTVQGELIHKHRAIDIVHSEFRKEDIR